MMPFPHLLALASLLDPTRGCLLAGGDHRQLSAITKHDFPKELRPSIRLHTPHLSAYDYLRALGAHLAHRDAIGETRGSDRIGDWRVRLAT